MENISRWAIHHKFERYNVSRKALFMVHKKDGTYLLPGGWENELKEFIIIGEDSTSFIYKLQSYEQTQWVGNKAISESFILPIGIHKTRLVQWVTGQLSLFQDFC